MLPASPWMTRKEAAQYTKRGVGLLAREVKAGRLQAATIGGRRELMFRREWLDRWIEDQSVPVLLPARRRA